MAGPEGRREPRLRRRKGLTARLKASDVDLQHVELLAHDPQRFAIRLAVPGEIRLAERLPEGPPDPWDWPRLEWYPLDPETGRSHESPRLSGCLEAFRKLVPELAARSLFAAPPEEARVFAERVLAFAQRWGVLGICQHRLPAGHSGGRCRPMAEVQGDDWIQWEPLEAWWRHAQQARAMLNVIASLQDGWRGEDAEWDAIAHGQVPPLPRFLIDGQRPDPPWAPPRWSRMVAAHRPRTALELIRAQQADRPGSASGLRQVQLYAGGQLQGAPGQEIPLGPGDPGYYERIPPPEPEQSPLDLPPIPTRRSTGAATANSETAPIVLDLEREWLERALNRWLAYGSAVPVLNQIDGRAVPIIGRNKPGGLVGVLGIQLAAAYVGGRICSWCGGAYAPERHPPARTRHFCSPECADQATLERKRRSWRKHAAEWSNREPGQEQPRD